LKNKGLPVSLASVSRLIKKPQITGSMVNQLHSGGPTKLSVGAKTFIDQQMQKNDETTSQQIQKKLAKCGIATSSSTVRRSRQLQGWTAQQTAYCQLIQDLAILEGHTSVLQFFCDICNILDVPQY